MKKQQILTAAAAVATFGVAADATAAPITWDLTFTEQNGGASTGTGFFTIDDSLISPFAWISDPADIDDFGATFINVPDGVGTVSFDEDDLNAVSVKFDVGENLFSVTFGTGGAPELNLDAPNVQELKTEAFGEVIDYDIAFTLRTDETAVPEPGTLALLAAGAAGLPLLRRRRKQRAA